MKVVIRKPDFIVEIVRPNYSASSYQTVPPVIRFVSSSISGYSETEIISNDLISYQFSESLATVNSEFSLELVPSLDRNGKSWLEKIRKRDLVFIYEFGELRFAGYVKSNRYAARMGSDGKPNRKIRISGGGLGEYLSSFKLVLNQAMYAASTIASGAAASLSTTLAAEIEKDRDVGALIKVIYQHFIDLIMKIGLEGVNIGIKPILDHFLDFDSEISDDLKTIYPVAFSLYRVGENSLWHLLSNFIFPPVNELFGRWNPESKKYEIVYRLSPFEPKKWSKLDFIEIPSIIITDHDIGTSDAEVFTFYLGMLPGSGISQNLAIISANDTGKNYIVDREKWKIYGYQPMIVEFKYYDRSKTGVGASVIMREVSEMLKRWFEHNDEFYSGSLAIMTSDNKNFMKRNPRIGEKIKFLEGEFYLESSDHSWEYGGPMVTKLTITRGYKYDASGNMEGPLDQVSRKLEAISQEVVLEG